MVVATPLTCSGVSSARTDPTSNRPADPASQPRRECPGLHRLHPRPVSTVNLWLTRHGLHVHRRHSNHLVRRLALTLVAAGMTQIEVAKLADVTRHSIHNWSRRYPLPALAPGESYDAPTISFYRALLSGATPPCRRRRWRTCRHGNIRVDWRRYCSCRPYRPSMGHRRCSCSSLHRSELGCHRRS